MVGVSFDENGPLHAFMKVMETVDGAALIPMLSAWAAGVFWASRTAAGRALAEAVREPLALGVAVAISPAVLIALPPPQRRPTGPLISLPTRDQRDTASGRETSI